MKLAVPIALALAVLIGSIAAVQTCIASSRAPARAAEAREAAVRIEMAALRAAHDAGAAAHRELEGRVGALESLPRAPAASSARRREAPAAGGDDAPAAPSPAGAAGGAETAASPASRE